MSFSETLLQKAEPYYQAQTRKPFVQGMLDGTLPMEKFLYWVRVDYAYLVNFSRILALGVTKADTFEDMRVMQEYLHWIVNEEMGMQESYAAEHGITKHDLESAQMGPIKYAYTRHELASAYSGTMGELLAGIMACIVGYQIVCRKLLSSIETIDPENPYRDWFSMYSSDVDLDTHTKKVIDIFDRMASEGSANVRASMEEKFMTGVRYETMCWDAYFEMEEWISH